jgi:hypothetical protein
MVESHSNTRYYSFMVSVSAYSLGLRSATEKPHKMRRDRHLRGNTNLREAFAIDIVNTFGRGERWNIIVYHEHLVQAGVPSHRTPRNSLSHVIEKSVFGAFLRTSFQFYFHGYTRTPSHILLSIYILVEKRLLAFWNWEVLASPN